MFVQTSYFRCTLILILSFCYVHSARILGVFQYPSISHQVVFQQIWRELSLRGHDVVVVTPNPLNDPKLVNLTEIDVGSIKNLISAGDDLQSSMSKDSPTPQIMKAFYDTSLVLQDAIFKDKQFNAIYNNSKEKFDLVMVESHHPGMYSLAGRFDCPSIGISSLGVVIPIHGSVGNTNHPVLYPDMNLPVHSNLNVFQKIYSIYNSIFLNIYYDNWVMKQSDEIARKYLGNDIPYLGDLANNVSFLLINTNHIIHTIRPHVPKIIQMGQMHIRKPKPLPTELKTLLDNAKNGVIYFSLGSNVKSVNIDKNLQKIFLETMADLPYTVLWKWEADALENKPNNVITRKWFPQQDLLAHPNVKAFVTQGGLQSIEEAISREVPMVGLPFIGDQPMTLNKLSQAGVALVHDPVTVTKEELKSSIIKVATDPSFRRNIHKAKIELEDQPETGLERAVWWIEYAIRHKGAPHLKSPTADVKWWEFIFLDVILVLSLAMFIFLRLAKFLYNILSFIPKEKQY
ncbi:unnamed protein product [Brassicogethes aeneus]|uniref:UDP-glucuronosyltransferase n=1 Tax=Brassicogethes aeneus TaxID=1431903 RepID=A0A9P0AWW6_BRAAE|nr:unnamed protein product [Brassicogethes aeneus]